MKDGVEVIDSKIYLTVGNGSITYVYECDETIINSVVDIFRYSVNRRKLAFDLCHRFVIKYAEPMVIKHN